MNESPVTRSMSNLSAKHFTKQGANKEWWGKNQDVEKPKPIETSSRWGEGAKKSPINQLKAPGEPTDKGKRKKHP